MTAGLDVEWRRQVIRLADLSADGRILDLGAGTGDLTREALRQIPDCRPVSADFTLGMMQAGQRLPGPALEWSCADALAGRASAASRATTHRIVERLVVIQSRVFTALP